MCGLKIKPTGISLSADAFQLNTGIEHWTLRALIRLTLAIERRLALRRGFAACRTNGGSEPPQLRGRQ
jgi:hypothetical protein